MMIHRLSNHRTDGMPVKVRDWCFEDVDVHGSYPDLSHPYFQLEPTLSIGITAEFYTSTPLPSEDIWKKFDLPDLPSMSELTTWTGNSAIVDDCELDAVVEECTSVVASPMWATLDTTGVCGSGKESREIRHHDCMWAGHCINKEHKRTLQQQQTCHAKPSDVDNVVAAVTPRAAGCRNVRPSCGSKSTPSTQSVLLNSPKTDVCVVKTSGRSLLLTSRTTNSAKVVVCASRAPAPYHRPSLESDGDSPRPETPQSLSESEEELDDHPRFRHSLDMVVSSSVANAGDAGYLLDKAKGDVFDLCKDDDEDEDADSSMPVSVSEVTGQVFRPASDVSSSNDEFEKTSKLSDAYYNDHSYHLSKGSVRMDNLGVQTPSDSEEEIDVVSVGDKLPASRGGATLPTNPSPRDRQQLQLTVASAIKVKQQYEGGAGGKKRSAGGGLPRGTKRAKHQYHHRLAHHKPGRRPAASSDSEPDSCEKRSLHNNMERQRRVDLRNLVEGLRVLVPEVAGKKRAAKVVILREAAEHCHRLREQGKGLVGSVAALRREQEHLRARVSQLRRNLAASR